MYKNVGSVMYSNPAASSWDKEADAVLKHYTSGPSDFPLLVIKVGYSESLVQLRIDSHWWLISSCGATAMGILIEILKDTHFLKVQCWTIIQNPNAQTGNCPCKIPNCNEYFDIDASRVVTVDPEQESQDLIIPYMFIFNELHSYLASIVLLKSKLSKLTLSIFEELLKVSSFFTISFQ